MKFHSSVVILTLVIVLTGCIEAQDSNKKSIDNSKKEEQIEINSEDSIVIVSECSNEYYTAVLEENLNLTDNAFKLTIESEDGTSKKEHIVDTRPGMSQISRCTEDYVVVGFPCGGPCYARAFVFTNRVSKNESYSYAQYVQGASNLIGYIENEEFEKLIIHNLDNDKELVLNNDDLVWLNYGQMDSLYLDGNVLRLEYQSSKKETVKKSVSIQEILN